ncbi:MAG TPA: bifunctional diaminohydroxyphosphoribosylaminopyrimidine deaminase/5-amino-6-(5-phosphoribosylamino)uracil reductase RibD [Candidatus Krumholzibacteria bacterium]|nr:bifunctional diaminohydroxyphosphoribosylaminopyrimidine deaminase/5-amino-6-(5-phosphoribosylamino)uracil reductase RibD [Candidatus Krumholzibacteria bacterium]
MLQSDEHWMDRALALAASAYGLTSPNPMVGAVLVHGDNEIGSGVHRAAGQSHAEPQALEFLEKNPDFSMSSQDDLALYVNLEPCVHHGHTPPCVDAILRANVGRVVVGMVDPNPLVSGRGIARLRGEGVRVEVGCRWQAAAELNHVFVARQRRRRPFVALKVAISADGCIAGAGGERVRITGEAARVHTHQLRAGLDGIAVGVETLRRDRPRLDRRMYHGADTASVPLSAGLGPGKTPRRLVLDPMLRSLPEWLWPGEERAVVFCAEAALEPAAERIREVADVVALPHGPGGFDLHAWCKELERLALWSVLVEGGGRTHRKMLEADLWDRLYLYRNRHLRLAGMKWDAAEAWGKIQDQAVTRDETAFGPVPSDDILEVHDHRESVAVQTS